MNYEGWSKEEVEAEYNRIIAERDRCIELLGFMEKLEGQSDEEGIAAGLVVTEDELDRRIECGEITEENAKEFLQYKIVKWRDGTYGTWEDE